VTLAHGGGNTVPKGFCLMLSRTLLFARRRPTRRAGQAAQTPEKSKVFCFFSTEKKALLPSPRHTVRGILVRPRTRPCRLVDKRERLLQIQVSVPPEREVTALRKIFWFFSSEKNAFLSANRNDCRRGGLT
jgi:hypothetical protein